VVDKVTQRKLTGALVWLVICMVIILALVLITGSLYMDLKTAQGANRRIEKRIDAIRSDYEVYCRKE
jgi:ABC-type cobalt transport system substrate-binding protein